jgi:uncharacterized phiE125 gp8 family phage protein
MTLVVTSAPAEELITVDAAKRHLRIMADDFDDEIMQAVKAARSWCESYTSRTLRTAVTRTIKLAEWPSESVQLPYPPLLTVESVKYYAEADVDTTLSASNYHTILSTSGPGYLEWDDEAVLPTTSTRPDAVRIAYTAGYTELPPDAKYAILMKLSCLWGDETDTRRMDHFDRAAQGLLNGIDWGSYA